MIHCPGCGQGLRFDIPSQQMLCDYCSGQYDPAITEKINKDAKGNLLFETFVFACPSCGGELITTDQNDAIGFCPYCGGASMLYDRVHDRWEPQYVIPFQITKEQCKELYLKEAKRSFFTSRRYRDPALIEGFRGIYMPYWSYHAKQSGVFGLNVERKKFSTIESYRVKGTMQLEVDGYGHDASTTFDDRISEDLAPFDLSGQKPFVPGYLSGFYADLPDVDAQAYEKAVKEDVSRDTIRKMAAEEKIIHPDNGMKRIRVLKDQANIPFEIIRAERTMYPVWFMSYRRKNKITYAAVNGQTGRVSADLPVGPWKILLVVLLVGLGLAASMLLLPSIKANWTLAVSAVLLVVGYLILRLTYRNTVNEETGLRDTEEAKRFHAHEKWRMLLVILSAVAALVVALIDPAYNWISYLGCLLLAGELFWIMLRHIRFQAEIAQRKPPQFNKKGAAYDEA